MFFFRTWTLVRETTWRYPFALKWRRDISISTDLTVHVCADGHTICTIRHVAAIVSFVQTHVNPIAELGGEVRKKSCFWVSDLFFATWRWPFVLHQNGFFFQSIGTVVLGIKTLVAYPYMFVSGRATDDPPNDQISNSSLTDYNLTYSMYDSWARNLHSITSIPKRKRRNAKTHIIS